MQRQILEQQSANAFLIKGEYGLVILRLEFKLPPDRQELRYIL
ncbi:MAG: hypothetical protein ONB16_12705 [candidate division KSB1 bacterium]|nr:hypothetical protein [candidate division KSB1 bacterium]MDZ7319520.1 hypothetical protein [candidate division KSB1 bacterium]MDZ7342800.1 hypothetical protein [candidate division KSB1 bacterium]